MLVRRQTPGVSSLPPGVQVNYVDPPSIGYKLVVTDWVLLAPALLLTGIRIFTRLRLLKTWGWDDTFVIFALVRSRAAFFFLPLTKRQTVDCHSSQLHGPCLDLSLS